MKRLCCILLCLAITLSVLSIFACALEAKISESEEFALYWKWVEIRRAGRKVAAVLEGLIILIIGLFIERYRKEPQETHKVDEEQKSKSNRWCCTCGRDNPSYTHTCVCGKNKREVLNQ